MLCAYAPLETMACAGGLRGLRGTGRGDLQMDRLRRGGSFFPTSRCRAPKRFLRRAAGPRVRPQSNPLPSRGRRPNRARPWAIPSFPSRRRSPIRLFFGDDVVSVHLALEPALKPRQSITLAFERQGTRGTRHAVRAGRACPAVPTSLPPPSPIRRRAKRAAATASPSIFAAFGIGAPGPAPLAGCAGRAYAPLGR